MGFQSIFMNSNCKQVEEFKGEPLNFLNSLNGKNKGLLGFQYLAGLIIQLQSNDL